MLATVTIKPTQHMVQVPKPPQWLRTYTCGHWGKKMELEQKLLDGMRETVWGSNLSRFTSVILRVADSYPDMGRRKGEGWWELRSSGLFAYLSPRFGSLFLISSTGDSNVNWSLCYLANLHLLSKIFYLMSSLQRDREVTFLPASLLVLLGQISC